MLSRDDQRGGQWILTLRSAVLPTPPKEVVISKQLVGERVRALREARNMSQGDLAKVLGIQPTNVSAIEARRAGSSLQQLQNSPRPSTSSRERSRSPVLETLPERFHRSPTSKTREDTKPTRRKHRVLSEMIDAFIEKHSSQPPQITDRGRSRGRPTGTSRRPAPAAPRKTLRVSHERAQGSPPGSRPSGRLFVEGRAVTRLARHVRPQGDAPARPAF